MRSAGLLRAGKRSVMSPFQDYRDLDAEWAPDRSRRRRLQIPV